MTLAKRSVLAAALAMATTAAGAQPEAPARGFAVGGAGCVKDGKP